MVTGEIIYSNCQEKMSQFWHHQKKIANIHIKIHVQKYTDYLQIRNTEIKISSLYCTLSDWVTS